MSFYLKVFHTVKDGAGVIEYAFPTEEFWRDWRHAGDSLASLGYSLAKDAADRWVVKRYSLPAPGKPAKSNGYELRKKAGLFPYQVRTAGQLCASLLKHGAALDGSDAGTGKTYHGAATAREFGAVAAVVCPRKGRGKWRRLLQEYGVPVHFVAGWEECKGSRFKFGSFSKQGEYTWKIPLDKTLIIFDEAHRAKGERTQNAQLVVAAKRQGYKVLAATATSGITPRDFRALGYLLGVHHLFDFDFWSAAYDCYRDPLDEWDVADSVSAMKKLNKDIFPSRGGRVAIADLGDEFPETQVTADLYEIEAPEVQNEAYEKLLQEIARLKEEKKGGALFASLSLRQKYHQQAELLKVPVIAELANDYINSGMSVAIFVNFNETREALCAALVCPSIHGGQIGAKGDAERETVLADFQADRNRCLVLNMQAGGDLIDLHDLHGNFPRVALIAPTDNPITLKQVLGRVRRKGGKTKSLQRIIYAAGTVEESICYNLSKKLASMDAFNDGDLMEKEVWEFLKKKAD